MASPLICGFLKIRNEILRSGNLYRVLRNMAEYCDDIFVVDDASYDGTYEYLKSHIIPEDRIIRVPLDQHDFAQELYWKQQLLERVHSAGPYEYVFWVDGDEVLDAKGTAGLRDFCRNNLGSKTDVWSFHYTQVWRNTEYARIDDGFDDGWFYKLWRYYPDLSFSVSHGTHKAQFPSQISNKLAQGRGEKAPFEIIHYGNAGVNLRMKCIQYYGGLGGVDRHLHFEKGSFRKVSQEIFPDGAELMPGGKPEPFTPAQCERILSMKDLKGLEKTFAVIVPAYSRAATLPRALDSLIAQTYDKWVCFVLDDGSTDNTAEVVNAYVEKDPRIFYLRYHENRGGVAMNEIGMEIAVNTCEWWTRLGSDDWFVANKLELDAKAFETCDATFSSFVVHRNGSFDEIGNMPCPSDIILPGFLKGGFYASWANCAVKSSILAQVKIKFKNYCDPGLQNMEDLVFNFRVAKLVPWVWHGICNGEFIINPSKEDCQVIMSRPTELKPSAVWNVNQIGASADSGTYSKDHAYSQQIIQREKDL